MALFFHVVILRKRRDQRGTAGQLADAAENDFRAAVVQLDGSVNFDGLADEASNVADIFEVGRKDDNRKRAGGVIFAKIKEVNAAGANFDANNFAGDALYFADVLSSILDGEAVGGEERVGRYKGNDADESCRNSARVALHRDLWDLLESF